MSEERHLSPSLKSGPTQNPPKATSESSKTTSRHWIGADILFFSWTGTSSNLLHPVPVESNFTFTENYNQKPIWFVTCWLKSSTIPICHNLAQTVWNPKLQLMLKNMYFFFKFSIKNMRNEKLNQQRYECEIKQKVLIKTNYKVVYESCSSTIILAIVCYVRHMAQKRICLVSTLCWAECRPDLLHCLQLNISLFPHNSHLEKEKWQTKELSMILTKVLLHSTLMCRWCHTK